MEDKDDRWIDPKNKKAFKKWLKDKLKRKKAKYYADFLDEYEKLGDDSI